MSRSPNARLRLAMEQSELSYEALAREVSTLATTSSGRVVSISKVAVLGWLGGSQPKPQTARYLLEVLSRKLGRPWMTLRDIGLAAMTATTPNWRTWV